MDATPATAIREETVEDATHALETGSYVASAATTVVLPNGSDESCITAMYSFGSADESTYETLSASPDGVT